MKLFANLFKSSQAAAPQAAAGKKAPTTRPLSIEPADPKDSAVLSGIHEKALGEPLGAAPRSQWPLRRDGLRHASPRGRPEVERRR